MAKGQDAVDFHQSRCKNQKFGLSTLQIRGQSPKVVALQNAYMTILFLPRRRTLEESLGQG
jgi:hypothetical protein